MEGKPYSVLLFLTHPDQDNDDCMTGEDFETEAEARSVMANLDSTFDMAYHRDCAFVMLDGPDVNEIVERPGVARRNRREARQDRESARREHAMQQGMGLGIDAYNEAMGYD